MSTEKEAPAARESEHVAADAASAAHPTHYVADKESAQQDADRPLLWHQPEAATGAQPPSQFTGDVKLSRPAEVAGGVPAVVSAMKFALREAGTMRGARTLLRVNQKEGFDCPGCAWPDPEGERSFAEFCENGAKHVADEATTKRVTPEFFQQHSVAELAQQSDQWLNAQGRLTHPVVLRRGGEHYEVISWDEAFKLVAEELNALASPDEVAFYTSGRTSNEAAFLYQLFVRQFGTNNMPDCSNMCHESSGTALTTTIGVGKGTVTLEDFDRAELILVVGQNPGTNHPRMLTALRAAKQRGCKIVHVNPLPEAGLVRFKHPQEAADVLGSGVKLADLFLQVRINGDVALLKGLMKEVLGEERLRPGEVLDQDFIREHTAGFDDFAQALEEVSWDEVVEESGVSRDEMRAAARLFVDSSRTIVCWAMGLTQHKNAVANIQEIVNLLLLRGQIGKPGAGVCPVRGHSNVQGDRTMGVWDRPTPAFLDALAREFNFEPPREHGLDTVETIKAMRDGRVKIFFALGGNFLSAAPDTEFTGEALRRCRLTAHVSTKLNRAHLVTGEQALILPCLGRTERDIQSTGEQFVTVENSMGIVHASRGTLAPASEHLLSEPQIVARLAESTLNGRGTVDWLAHADDYDRVRELIARVIPGCDDYNRRVRVPGGFYLPNHAREGRFVTDTERANFTVHELPRLNLAPGQFLMMTVRSHDQFNTTIYDLDDRYRGIHHERRVVFLNREDAREAGLSEHQSVDLVSHFAGGERVARNFLVVPYDIPRRCAATYFPEANVLVHIGAVADKSNTPASKSVVITVRPSTNEV